MFNYSVLELASQVNKNLNPFKTDRTADLLVRSRPPGRLFPQYCMNRCVEQKELDIGCEPAYRARVTDHIWDLKEMLA
jgi:hypothetical protein